MACGAVIGLLTVLFSADGYRREIAIALHEFVTWIDPSKRPIRIKADARGHYYLTGRVNGIQLQFMVNSGATSVVLNRAAARQLDLGQLNFDTVSSTANGTVLNAENQIEDDRIPVVRRN